MGWNPFKGDLKVDGINFSEGRRFWRNIRKTVHLYKRRHDDPSQGSSSRKLVGNTGFSRYVTPLSVHGGASTARDSFVGNTGFKRFTYG